MKYHAENAVSSFFYYMWNAWSKEECKIVFGGMCRHFWGKWNAQAEKSIYGAAERFYSELSENNQKLLVERAVSLYDGKAFRKEPDDSKVLVCEECGSRQVEIQAWIDANTEMFVCDTAHDVTASGVKNVRRMSTSVLWKNSSRKCRFGGPAQTSVRWKISQD